MIPGDRWRRFGARRISRRTLLQAGAATATSAAGLALLGCAGGNTEANPPTITPQATEGAPLRGGTLVFGAAAPPSFGLDPHTEIATGLTIFPRVYGYMLHVDPRDDSVLLDQAQGWEQPDETTYVIRLQPGVRFQNLAPVNGREVEAEDVVASFYRFRDNPLVSDKNWHANFMQSAQAPDRLTVVVKVKRPYAYTLDALGGIRSGVIIPRELTDFTKVDLSTSGVGSGPYIIDKVALEEDIELVRNPDYFRQPLPYIDRLVWKIIPDDATRVAAFEDRQIHVMGNRDKAEYDEIASFSDDVQVHAEPSLAYASFAMRVDQPPFNDDRVRRAVDVGMDRQQLIDQIASGEAESLGPINQHLAGGFWSLPEEEVGKAYRSDLKPNERRKEARDLLSAAGALDTEIKVQAFTTPLALDIAAVLQNQLQRMGFNAQLEPLELLAWFANLRQGNFQGTIISHSPYESPDTPTRYYYSLGLTNTGSWFGYSNREIDALIEKSWGQFDREERRQTLLELQRLILQEHGPMLNILTGRTRSSAWNFVKNWRPDLPDSLQQYNYGLWLDVSGAARGGARETQRR